MPALATAVRRVGEDARLRARLREGGYRTAAAHTEDEFNRRAVEELAAAAARHPRRS